MRKIVGLQILGIVSLILGNYWMLNINVSEFEEASYQIRIFSWIPQWLPLVLFLIVLILLFKNIQNIGNIKKVIVLQVLGLITYLLGNYWFYLVNIEGGQALHQIKVVTWIPQGLSLVLFIITFILLIKEMQRK